MRLTNEGGVCHEHSLDHAVEFFSKAGSLFTEKESFYGYEESALALFQKVWIVDKQIAMKLLLWLRDCRGGAGNRSAARECYKWLVIHAPEWMRVNIHWLPEVGRWDDLRSLFYSTIERDAAKFWADEIFLNNNKLAAKWADRSDKPILNYIRNMTGRSITIGEFRRLLAHIRKNHIVEHKMCTKNWDSIQYNTVPSVAMARYTKAFMENDEERFSQYKEDLANGKETIKASVLFPHDCVRTVYHGDADIADAQFDALPNFLEEVDERIIVISDTSGSMGIHVCGSVLAVHISQGLALYCSAKMPKNSPFYKKFIGFCSEGSFKDWEGMKFSEAVKDFNIFDHAVGGTRIDKALKLILKTAKFFNVKDDQIPTTLLIVSDMQFHQGVRGGDSEVSKALILWGEANYKLPKVVYWNTAGYTGSTATVKHNNVGLVSGFSPAILKAIFGGDSFTPESIMLRALEKYKINIPE